VFKGLTFAIMAAAVALDFDYIALLIPTAVAYAVVCKLYPYRACSAKACEGGRVRAPGGDTFRLCRPCDGTGRKLRLGRRLTAGL